MKKIPALLGGALITVSAASAAIGLTGVRTDIKEFSPRTLVPTEISSKDIKAKGLKPVVKESALTTSSRMSAPAREGSSEGWTSIGTGLFTDAVFPDMFNGIEPTTFDVEIEQNDADPTTYRIVNPYANWDNPYSNLTYHDNPANYLVFHIVNDQYAYIEDFNTGYEFVDESETLGEGDDYFVKVISQAQSLIEGNGLDLVVSACPSVFATYENGVIKQSANFQLNGNTYSSLLMAWGNTEQGYYRCNTSGSFTIALPGAEIVPEPEVNWVSLGTGSYTDDLLASLFSDVDVETMSVEIQQDADDATHYRIPDPYANHSVGLTKTGNGAIEFYVVNEEYVYFTKMDLGVSFQGVNLTAKMNAGDMISAYGPEAVYAQYPGAFAQYDNGAITASTYFDVDGSDTAVFLLPYGGRNYIGNRSGALRIEFPSNEPQYNWQSVGTGKFTDDFLASFLEGVEISTFDVAVERDADDANHYRLVNPYANWQNSQYSATANGVAEFYIVDNAYAYFPKFVTGVRHDGKILTVSHNVMGPINSGMALADIIATFPDALAKFDNGVLTATTTFDNGGEPFSVFQIPVGNILHRVNLSGAFRLELPGYDNTDTPTINGINYEINREAKTATVIGCDATMTNVEIPATITVGETEYTVVAIGDGAFMANKTITSLSIPATITTVGQDACRNMGGLKDLYINDLAAWCAIEFYNGNANPIYNVFPTRESAWGNVHFNDVINPAALEIPEGVTEIGRAFYGYKVLESVTLPSTLTKLGDQTFANCAKLTEVVVPEGVTSIGSAFWSCTALKSVTLPSTLENITGSIFYGCEALESIELPAALQTVGRMAFSDCEALTSITSYAAVPPTAGMMAFYDVPVDIPVNVPESSIEAYKAADEWKDFTNYIGFKVSVNPFEPKGDEEVIGQLQILYHPTGDKVNILKDAAQLGEGADGWSVQCMNESKNLEQAGSITIDGVAYPTIKLSNGAQNTVTLPEGYVANAVTIYSVINKDGATARPCYFKEIDGVEYTSDKDYLVSFKDFANPDVSYFTLKGKNTFTFTNSGEQALVVLVVDYSEAPKSPFGDAALDAPASVWPSNGSAMLPLDGSIKLSYGVDVEVFGNATLNDKEIALAVENNVVSIDYTGLTPSTEYTLTIPAKGIGNTEASNTEDIVYTFTTAPENVLFYADFNNYPFGYSEKYRDIDDNVNIIAKNSTDVTAEVAGMTFYSGSKGRVVALKAPLNPEDPEADYGPYLPEYAGASARTVQLIGGGNGLYVETPEVEGPCELTFYIANASTTAGTLILTDERGDKEKALTEFAIEGAKKMFKYTYSYPYKGAVKFRLYNQKVQINVNDILIIKGEGPGIERPGEEPDTEAPVTTAVWPGTEAYAPVEGNVVVTFDEPIAVTGKASLNGADLDINVEGNTLTVAYAGLENGKHYTMEIPAVSDKAGNAAEPFTVDINTVADDVIYYTDFAQYPYSYFTAYNHIPNEGADNEDIIAKNSTDVTATVAGITYYSGTNGRVVAMGKPNLFEDAGEEHVGASARCIQISGGENGLYAELPATEGPCDLTIFVGNGPATAGSILLTDAQGDTENPLATFTLPAEKKMYRFDYKHTAEGPVTLRLYNMGTQFNLHDILLVKGNTSGINVIDADDAEAVYYNLQGVRVENPAAGLYIRVRGQKVDKVIVK